LTKTSGKRKIATRNVKPTPFGKKGTCGSNAVRNNKNVEKATYAPSCRLRIV